jgi:YD repeat-containing protein
MNRCIKCLGSFMFLLAFLCQPAVAIVNMQNCNFSDTWTDVALPLGTDLSFNIQRTYNSRSNYDGMFGYGWCSDWETSLITGQQGEITIVHGGAGMEETFFPDRSAPGRYYNEDRSESLEKKGQGYEWQTYIALREQKNPGECPLPHPAVKVYDEFGRLVTIRILDVGNIQITYTGFRREIRQIRLPTDDVLTFHYCSNGKIIHIVINDNKNEVHYRYSLSGDLIEVKNTWGNTYLYNYDDYHKLTKIDYPDHTSKELRYDIERDWVISFKNRDGCREYYQYISYTPMFYESLVTKTCKDKIVNRSRYTFWFAINPKGVKYQSRVLVEVNGVLRDTRYHPLFGKPVYIRSDIQEFFQYGDSGEFRGGKVECEDGRVFEFPRITTGEPVL